MLTTTLSILFKTATEEANLLAEGWIEYSVNTPLIKDTHHRGESAVPCNSKDLGK